MSKDKEETGVDEAEAKPERQWPVTVTLKHPFDHGSERISKLEFRRGRAGDMKGIALKDNVPADDLMKIASRLCGQTVKVLEQLDIDDVGEVTDIALDFYVKYIAAGRKSSR